MNKRDFFERNGSQYLHQDEMERKWRIHQEEILREQMMMFEAARAASSAAVASGAGGGYLPPENLCQNSSVLAGVIDWGTYAPGGTGGPEGLDYLDFDYWTTENFPAITDVTRLSITSSLASAHVHEDHEYSDLTIDLYNSSTSTWVTVWSYRLENTNYPDDTSDDFFFDGFDITFPSIPQVTAIRMTSDPGSDQSYHDWGSVNFNMYQCGAKTPTLKLVWNDITNVPVLDPTSVSDWNDFFNDPFFTEVTVIGNVVNLTPNGTVTIYDNLFSPGKSGNQYLLQIIDDANCVTWVGEQAISNCYSLTKAILPACTFIGFAAFENSYNIATVDFSAVEEVSVLGLGDLNSLKTLNMPALITAGTDAFAYSDNLVSFTAPNLVTMGDSCFNYCYSLTSISLPLLTSAGDAAFYYCDSLTSVYLPSLVTLGVNSFNNCTSLTTLSLPLLESVGTGCFANNANLVTASFPELINIDDITFGYSINLTSLSIPKCTQLGSSVADNNVFYNIGSITKPNFTLTIDPSRMTCNGGLPDGDIITLAMQIDPGVLTVNGTPVPNTWS